MKINNVDRVSKKQRSRNMAAVSSRGNKSTENKLLTLFRRNKVNGWRRHYKRLIGTPDFVFLKNKLAVFVDGCFWHGCKKCRSLPKTNTKFWKAKIYSNKERDARVSRELKRDGWVVIRIKEHILRERPQYVLKRVKRRYAK